MVGLAALATVPLKDTVDTAAVFPFLINITNTAHFSRGRGGIAAEQGRAETQDALLRRLFPAGPPAPEGIKRPREAYRAQKGGRLPRGIFVHIVGFWRSSRDPLRPKPALP